MLMKTTVLNFLFVAIIHSSFGQNPNLIPFVIYKDCLYGLKNATGKVVWKAELDEVKPLVTNWKGYNEQPEVVLWLAKKYGLYGILDQKGTLIVPFEYKNIRVDQENLIVASRPEMIVDLYTYSCERIRSISGIDNLFSCDKGYRVTNGRKWGFLDTNFQRVLPTEYDGVRILYMASDNGLTDDDIHSDRYLKVEMENKNGVYDRFTEKMIVPPVYDEVDPQWYVKICPASAAAFMTYKNENSEMGLFDEHGKQVFTIVKNRFDVVVTPSDSCGTEALVNLYYRVENGKMVVLNTKTGQKSQEYDELASLGARSAFRNGKMWGVLDTNLSELYDTKKYTPLFQSLIYYDYPYHFGNLGMFYNWQTMFNGLKWSDDVILISDTTKLPKSKEHDFSCAFKVGMIHYTSGKVILPKYAEVRVIHCDGRTIFWAFKGTITCQEMGNQILGVDIYDEQLTLLRSINGFVDMPKSVVRPDELFLVSKEMDDYGKYGAINYKGDEIVPVKYDSYFPIKIPDKSVINPELILVAFLDKTGYGIFKSNGEELIPFEYKKIEAVEGVLIAGTGDSLVRCYDVKGNVLLDDGDYWFHATALNDQGTCLTSSNYGFNSGSSTYIIRGKEVYRIVHSQVQRIDSTTFHFDGNYLLFAPGHAINRKGELVKIHFRHRYFPRDECSLVFNEMNEIVYEEPKRTTNYNPPPAKKPDYEWKVVHGQRKTILGWEVYNSFGNKLHNLLFDYPVNPKDPAKAIFHTKGKFGVFNATYEITIQPAYDYIYPYKGYLLYADSSWSWYSNKTGKYSETFDAISIFPFGDKQLVFRDGKIGVLNDSLRLVVPMTDSLEMVKNVDLCKLLNINNKPLNSVRPEHLGLIVGVAPEKLYRQRNNALIIQAAYTNSTALDAMKIEPVHSDYPQNVPNVPFRMRPDKQLGNHRVHVATSSFYSEEINFCNYSDYNFNCYERQVANYRIVNAAFVLLQYGDVFKTDQASVNKLDELLLQKITENQTFGAHCTDIQTHIAELKKNFLITRYGINFYLPATYSLELTLSFKEIQSVLKKPFPEKTIHQ